MSVEQVDPFPPRPPHGSINNLRKSNVSPLGIAFMLFCLVSAGAFGIEEIIPSAGPGLTLAVLVILPIIWARPISSLVAEANAILPREGGIYAWSKEAFGEFWGFQAGWWTSIDTYIASGAYVAMAGGYTAQLLNLDPTGEFAVKALIILIFTAVNLAGLKDVERISSFFSILILLVFGAVVVLGFMFWQTNPLEPMLATPGDPLTCLSDALSIGVWMYCGYECIAAMSGEYEDSRVVAKGFRIALPLIAISYILPTLACLAAYPAGSWTEWGIDGGIDQDVLGYGTIFSMVLGPSGVMIFLVVAIASQCAIYNTSLASGARNFWALSEDRLFPQFIRKVDKSGRSPYMGILTISISSLIFSQFDFTTIIEMDIVFILACYMLLGFVVIKLRKMYPVADRPSDCYVIGNGKGNGKLLLYVGLVFCIAAFCLCLTDVVAFFVTIGFLMSGLVAYVVFKRLYGGLSHDDPENHPIDPKTKLAAGDAKRIGAFFLVILGLFAFNLVLNLFMG